MTCTEIVRTARFIAFRYYSPMPITPHGSLIRILADIDQKISHAKLVSDTPGDVEKWKIAMAILTDLRDALEEVAPKLRAGRGN
jgi:hypothetical protein